MMRSELINCTKSFWIALTIIRFFIINYFQRGEGERETEREGEREGGRETERESEILSERERERERSI